VTASCFGTVLQAGQTSQCSADVQGTGSFSSAVTWQASAGSISSAGLFTAANSGAVTVTATSVQDTTKSGNASLTTGPIQKSNFTYSGITLTSYSTGEYSSAAEASSATAQAATGSNWAGVLVTQFQANATATSIAPVAGQTPSDADVVAAIGALHAQGLKVMLKPHVDGSDGSWRGTFQPSNLNAWFASFTTFIDHYATLAQQNNVDMLCFGTEYVDLTVAGNLPYWTNVIKSIRGIYTGPLVYAANAVSIPDEFNQVPFWSQVDVIGLDGYFPLTNQNDPTIAQLVAAWSNNVNGDNVVAAVTNFTNAHSPQPVIFSEIGYRSVAGTNQRPYDYSFSGSYDPIEQQDCYQAMYEVWNNSGIIQGHFWWAWQVSQPAPGDTEYAPWTKPADTILQAWQ
jgi:hypothetical protein